MRKTFGIETSIFFALVVSRFVSSRANCNENYYNSSHFCVLQIDCEILARKRLNVVINQ